MYTIIWTISKTNYVLFKPKRIKLDYDINHNFQLKFGTEVIENKPFVKFLGLLVDEHLDWSHHCNYVMNKLSSSLYMMNTVKNFLPPDSRKILYHSFFHSYLSYGVMLWGPSTSAWYQNKLLILQKKAMRIIKNVPYNTPNTDAIFQELRILKLEQFIDLEIAKLMYKVAQGIIPKAIKDIFVLNRPLHRYSTRHINDPQFNQTRNFAGISKSFLCKGPEIWSKLDNKIKSCKSVKSFSRQFKNTFFT